MPDISEADKAIVEEWWEGFMPIYRKMDTDEEKAKIGHTCQRLFELSKGTFDSNDPGARLFADFPKYHWTHL